MLHYRERPYLSELDIFLPGQQQRIDTSDPTEHDESISLALLEQ